MSLSSDLKELEDQLRGIPDSAHRVLAAQNGALYLLDLIIVGAAKRSLSFGHGLISMVGSKKYDLRASNCSDAHRYG